MHDVAEAIKQRLAEAPKNAIPKEEVGPKQVQTLSACGLAFPSASCSRGNQSNCCSSRKSCTNAISDRTRLYKYAQHAFCLEQNKPC